MTRMRVPPAELVEPFIGGALGAVTWDGGGPTRVQTGLLDALLARFSAGGGDGAALTTASLGPWTAEQVRRAITDPVLRTQLAHLVFALELVMHPLPEGLEHHAERYLAEAGVEMPFLSVVRDTAAGHLARLHADLLRNSWYTEQTVKGFFSGRFGELVRSKLSYYSIGTDDRIADRWRALRDCPTGSWGRTVADFYEVHGFAFPGEHSGIYEVGALHDWVHVLADYPADPEGEIDVFAFIAATMEDERGFIQFVFTLALFQNGSVDTVGGKHVPIARADTLSDPGAADRLADALYRASRCTVDVMGGVDHFAHADEPLDELRERWRIPPKSTPSPGALDLTR